MYKQKTSVPFKSLNAHNLGYCKELTINESLILIAEGSC